MKQTKYFPQDIEKKWQEVWKRSGLYKFGKIVNRQSSIVNKGKYYTLVELPYPSGDLHIGHWFTFVAPDVLSRYKTMKGFNVLFPMGYDAFGLPAENAAIKRGVHPKDWTEKNIASMTKQFETMGTMIDWDHVTITCLPEYYTWNQWIFIKMFEKGIAYRGKTLSNWCPVDQTVLANEHVENGKCWRCGATVVQKEVEQWFLKITDYAERLLWPVPKTKKSSGEDHLVSSTSSLNGWIDNLDTKISQNNQNVKAEFSLSVDLPGVEPGNLGLSIQPSKPARPAPHSSYKTNASEVNASTVDWPKSVMTAQNEWIGKSEGMEIVFAVIPAKAGIQKKDWIPDQVRDDNLSLTVFTTRPETTDAASFIVIAPEHPLAATIEKEDVREYVKLSLNKQEQERMTDAKTKTGVDTGYKAINPVTGKEIPIYIADYVLGNYGTGAVMGVPFADKRDAEFAHAKNLPILETSFHAKPVGTRKVEYHLRDWSVSRQRYWGTPVPMIHCDTDGIIPVLLKDLPITLPYDVDYQPKGKAPLASNEDWMRVKCPKCGKDARRDPETLDTFFDSSWYYYRYVDPNYTEGPFDPEQVKELMPVDMYFGGGEHTLGHTLYARFFTKFFKDLGMVSFDEFAKKRIQHGIVLGPDGNKMSKSKGNVINPDDVIREFGTDAVRIYLSFMMPYQATGPWSTDAMYGAFRFLKRIWDLQNRVQSIALTKEDKFQMNLTIKKVGEDINDAKNNTAIAAIMKWLNYLDSKETIVAEEFRNLLLILSPFAPHITEELWQLNKLSDSEAKDMEFYSIHQEKWPSHDDTLIVSDTVTIAIQVNGKLRDTIEISNFKFKISNKTNVISNENEKSRHPELVSGSPAEKDFVEQEARKSEKVKAHLTGKIVKKVIYVPGKIINFVL